MTASQLSQEISLLNTAKVRFLSIINQINNASLALEPIGGRISSLYTLDENSTPISLRSIDLRVALINLANNISANVLPSIDYQIYYKQQQMFIEQANGNY